MYVVIYHFHSLTAVYNPNRGVAAKAKTDPKAQTRNPIRNASCGFSFLYIPNRITASKMTREKKGIASCDTVKTRSDIPYSSGDKNFV